MEAIDNFYRDLGFKDQSEATKMIVSVDLTNRENMKAFKKWKDEDGTKDGLQKILDNQ